MSMLRQRRAKIHRARKAQLAAREGVTVKVVRAVDEAALEAKMERLEKAKKRKAKVVEGKVDAGESA